MGRGGSGACLGWWRAVTPAAWVLSLILSLPPVLPMPGWAETPDARSARLARIADEIAATVYGAPGVDPSPGLVVGGPDATAARLVAVAYHESGFAADVYAGRCWRGRLGNGGRCDSGRAVSIFQLRLSGPTREGWVGADFATDPRRAVVVALRLIRGSQGCGRRGGASAELEAYASGRCGAGHHESAIRIATAARLLAEHPRPAAVLPSGGRP